MAKTPKKVGRPTVMTKAVKEVILLRLAQGESLRRICRDEGLPDRETVNRHLLVDDEFRGHYAEARDQGLDVMAEGLLDIADDGTNDWNAKRDPEGDIIGWQVNGEHVQRSRLRVDTYKWYLSKLAPKRYADKLQVDNTHQGVVDGTPIQTATQVYRYVVKRPEES